jgi:hypothetical protein
VRVRFIERSIMDDSQNAQSTTCGARPGLRTRTNTQAWCMPHETPASPLIFSQSERVRTAAIRCRELREDQ